MTQHTNANDEHKTKPQRRRGGLKPFPVIEFEKALRLPEAIMEHSVDGEIRRVTLFKKLGLSPSSGPSQNLVSNSSKYGLTSGSYKASSLSITEEGRTALAVKQSPRKAIETQFQLAIKRFEPFNNLYEKLQDQSLPDSEILKDELGDAGVGDSDRSKAAEIFTANLRFLGLTHDVSGSEYVRSLDQVLEEQPGELTGVAEGAKKPHAPDLPGDPVKPAKDNNKDTPRPNLPELHVDIQIHIDSTASPEQIEKIFASMARHLYGRESN